MDEFGGPFQTVKPAVNDWLTATLPKFKGLTHAELQLLLKADFDDWLISCIGKAGTVVFTDTARCYHRGKPPVETDRSAIFFHYFSQRLKIPSTVSDRFSLANKLLLSPSNFPLTFSNL